MRGPRINTQWTHGTACFNHPALNDFIAIRDGFFPLRTILDLTLGEEVALYLRDQTSFMDELCRVRPFRLMLKTGIARNEYGPLAFLLFWVAHPDNPNQAFAAYDVYLNPHSQTQVDTWRHLAAQTHWHLFLVGDRGEQRDLFEIENTYELDAALDFILEACGPIQLVDFERALQNKMRFPELAERDRISIVNSMRDDFFQMLAQMCPPTSANADSNVSALMRQLIDTPTPWNMPSLQVVAGAAAAMTAKGQKTNAHDIFDILHAAVAIPYCDAYFCDKPMASLLCGKPLDYHKAYDIAIISQPADIAAYLEAIS